MHRICLFFKHVSLSVLLSFMLIQKSIVLFVSRAKSQEDCLLLLLYLHEILVIPVCLGDYYVLCPY